MGTKNVRFAGHQQRLALTGLAASMTVAAGIGRPTASLSSLGGTKHEATIKGG